MSEKKSPGIWALLGKGIATLFKTAKFLKVLFAGATFASYAYMFTWKFALMVLIAIGFHESGHVWAMKKMGIKTKGFYFLPFFGGAAIAEERYQSHGQQAFVAIMGPIWGFALATVTYVVYLITHQPLFAAVASWMALVNLFNLLPINPLDGGQILRTITFSLHSTLGFVYLGLAIIAGAAMAFYMQIGLFAILTIAAALDFIFMFIERRNKNKRLEELKELLLFNSDKDTLSSHYLISEIEILNKEVQKAMSRNQLLIVAGSYLTLVVLLFAVMFKTQHIPGADIALLLLKD